MEADLYKQVFQACEPDDEGFISLNNLANISRSHVDSQEVDKILEIFDNSEKDRLNFDDFCDYISNFFQESDKENFKKLSPRNQKSPPDIMITSKHTKMSNGGSPTGQSLESGSPSSDGQSGQGSPGSEGSPAGGQGQVRMLGDNLTHKRKMSRKNSRSRVSQTRLTGQIPLVNTSSEDEQDLEEDSFDRKIAEELEFAGKQLETSRRLPTARASPPRFLVRGSSSRSTLRSKSSGRLPFLPLMVTESPHKAVLSPISSVNNSIEQPRIFDDSVALTTSPSKRLEDDMSNNMMSRHSSPINRTEAELAETAKRVDLTETMKRIDLTETKDLVNDLAVKLNSLEREATNGREVENEPPYISYEFHDSLESETNKMKFDAELTINKLRQSHKEELRAISRERELEVSNYKLRLEQLQSDLDRLNKEKSDLTEKVRLLFMEKEASEDTVLRLQEDVARLQEDLSRTREDLSRTQDDLSRTQEDQRTTEVKVGDADSRDSTRERIAEVSKMSLGSDQLSTTESYENEYLTKIQQLASRIQQQDDFIQELKEDNLVLRNQKRALLEAFNHEKNRKSFLGVGTRNRSFSNNDNSIMSLETDDPQDIRTRTLYLHNQLLEQTDMYKKLKNYLDDVLMTIMLKNPEILEKSS